jgi:hypothetical protein
MIAMPHLMFLTLLALGALLLWMLDVPGMDTPTLTAGAVVMGLGAGLLMGAWL